MRKRKKLCSECLTGAEMYKIDNGDIICPYIECYKDSTCSFYKPVGKQKKGLSKLFKNIYCYFRKRN